MIRCWVRVLVLSCLAGCGSQSGGAGIGRYSALGESCTRTADCVVGAVCVALTCTASDDAGGADAVGDGGAGGQTTADGQGQSGGLGQVGEGGLCTAQSQCGGFLACVSSKCTCVNPQHGGLLCDHCKNGAEFPLCLACESDGYCNASKCTLAEDPDCNPAAPCDPMSCGYNKWDPACDCNYYGGVCEIVAHCSQAVCACDTDCTPPGGELKPGCVADDHCDSWCPTGSDPDCAGSAKDGAKCGNPTCNTKTGYCNAQPGTTSECPGDPDCDIGWACDGDGWCDGGCPKGSDPDC